MIYETEYHAHISADGWIPGPLVYQVYVFEKNSALN